MVRHVILWKLRDELTAEEKETVKAGIKAGLEGLVGKVPGLLEVVVNIDGRLDSSNADVMLDCVLESPEALKGYAVHPEHVAVADGKVRPYTVVRTCLDYEYKG
ncbi:MAG: Dabb family protein [Bacteroidaceae bacterium]|nr:Dabb family protein [Bacteroidaceae bacterium]